MEYCCCWKIESAASESTGNFAAAGAERLGTAVTSQLHPSLDSLDWIKFFPMFLFVKLSEQEATMMPASC